MSKPLKNKESINVATSHGGLATKLAELQQRIEAAHKASLLADLKAKPPVLIGVTKGQPIELIEEAIKLGVTDFGENRVQEAYSKWPDLKARYPHIALHLIGPLQSNKVKEAVALFDVIQTLDREKIAQMVADEAAKQDRTLRTFLQVNIGEEPQKSGVVPRDLDELVRFHKEHSLLAPTGLMCVPPEGDNPAPYFALLHELAKRHSLRELSMGMSGDFETALRFGATYVRIGTALFGPRA